MELCAMIQFVVELSIVTGIPNQCEFSLLFVLVAFNKLLTL